ncbi:MAG: plasmid pRiA4b ORF-3 family protein [Cyanobacteria bacterium J06648_10]
MIQPPLAASEAYQIKITLVDSAPDVWRQVVVPAEIVLSELHQVIQLAVGWENLHPYAFQVGLGADKVLHAPEQRLSEVLMQDQPMYYTYDFDSGWLHRIELEALDVSALTEGTGGSLENLPTCIAGESACPPEGICGVWGFEEMLLTIEDPEDPNYLDMLDKYGSFDPLAFSLAEANRRLGCA